MSFITEPLKAFADWLLHPSRKRVFLFADGSSKDAVQLSIKGANLCEMSKNKSLRVPPGCIISAPASMEYRQQGELSESLFQEFNNALNEIERTTGQIFGTTLPTMVPLLLCVRGAALVPLPQSNPFHLQAFSSGSESHFIPGLHKTLLVGLNDSIVEIITILHGRRVALRLYSQFLMSFCSAVYGVPVESYTSILEQVRRAGTHSAMNVWTEGEYETIVKLFKAVHPVEEDCGVQLRLVVAKLYSEWFADKSTAQRRAIGLPDDLGTAVIVQQCIIGDCGVLSTRSPTDEHQDIQGFLIKASTDRRVRLQECYVIHPKLKHQVEEIKTELEWMFKDMQDVEFVVDNEDVVHLLGAKAGHRTARANVKIAASMVQEGILTQRQAIMQIDPVKLEYYLRDHVESKDISASGEHIVIAKGISGNRGGQVSGKACFSAAEVLQCSDALSKILIQDTYTAEDVPAVKLALGVISKTGGADSEIAVLCRGLGKPCIVAADPLLFESDASGKVIAVKFGQHRIVAGEELFMDSDKGELLLGFHHPMFGANDPDLQLLLKWADDARHCRVYSSAESVAEATFALNFGADGLGNVNIQPHSVDMLLYLIATNAEDQQKQLISMEHSLFAQYAKIIRACHKKKVSIRLFDFSIATFLPSSSEDAALLATALNLNVADIKAAMLHNDDPYFRSSNTLLNALVHPGLVKMQLAAIFQAVLSARSEGVHAFVDLSVSMMDNVKELSLVMTLIDEVQRQCLDAAGLPFVDQNAAKLVDIGLLVSTPQQCLNCRDIIRSNLIKYLTFDLESLTELTMGINAFGMQKMTSLLLQHGVLKEDPLSSIDDASVGRLLHDCIAECKRISAPLTVGVNCGPHYISSRCIYYFNHMKIDFICSDPFKVPLARLITAQSHIDEFAVSKRYELGPDMITETREETKMDIMPEDWVVFF